MENPYEIGLGKDLFLPSHDNHGGLFRCFCDLQDSAQYKVKHLANIC